MKYIVIILSVLMLMGCRHDDMNEMETTYTQETQISPSVYYGDINNDTVVVINIEDMTLQYVVPSSGVKPYEIDQAVDDNLYVMNRDDFNIGIFNSTTNTIDDEIVLNFKPRTLVLNGTNGLVTSVDEPSAAVITSNIASNSYNDSSYIAPSSFGGINATGHPVWVDDRYFLLLDRTENSIELYEIGNYNIPVSKFTTQSSVHHVLIRGGYFYGIEEGEQDGVSPGVVKFSVANGILTLVKEQLFSDFANLPADFVSATWGSHHGAIHPSDEYIYVGSAEGNVFVMDLLNLNLVDSFVSGKGAGHFLFYNDMLITTNHYDNFKSFYDATNPESNIFIKNLEFSQNIYDGITMQSHTSHIVDGKLYFTFNTDVDSTLYKINLADISIEDSLVLTGKYCLMGSFIETTVLIKDEM